MIIFNFFFMNIYIMQKGSSFQLKWSFSQQLARKSLAPVAARKPDKSKLLSSLRFVSC